MFKNIISNTIRLTQVKKTLNQKTTTNFATETLSSIGTVSTQRNAVTLPASSTLCQTTKNKLNLGSTRLKQTMSTTSKASGKTEKPAHTNRLANTKSPYLLQHAHNPVDWYPWGEEAFERARRENKIIFLSVGYSTCHWCHVMERESFENEDVAAIMNEHFINIKVDREERPDIDRIYMQFVLLLNGSGGWPMSVWLTPDLAPITAGTYFPPTNRYGMPSFTTVLKTIAEKWKNNQDELTTTGHEVINAIQSTLTEKSSDAAALEPGSADAKLQEALRIFTHRFDVLHGGFGSHPKFPEVSRLNLLFHAYIVTKDSDVLDMATQSLMHIGKGGIHDHVFGGFSRYSVDRVWHVPHFEKMLYDQGQLLVAFAHAYKLTKSKSFLRYGEGIFRYLMKDLRHPSGGFFSGEDADSYPKFGDAEKIEGAFYAWRFEEIEEAVKANADLYGDIDSDRAFEIYAYHYDVRPTGNVEASSDPHGHLNAKNILIVRGSDGKTCAKFNITEDQLQRVLEITNGVLHKIREQRPRPHLDTKIICAWNGLVLSGLAKFANCGTPRREEFLEAARKLVQFIKEHLYDANAKTLLRSCYGVGTDSEILESTEERIEGFLDDYAFLIKGLLDYYKATLEPSALQWAKELQDIQDSLFWDSNSGGYFYSKADLANVIIRLKEDHDGAEPSGNSISARNLMLLSYYFDDETYRERTNQVLQFYADSSPFGYTLPAMMSALLLYENGLDLVAVVGPNSNETQRLVEICREYFIPGMIIIRVDPEHMDEAHHQRIQKKFKMMNGKPTVYICHNKACRMPVTDPVELENNLKDNFSGNRF